MPTPIFEAFEESLRNRPEGISPYTVWGYVAYLKRNAPRSLDERTYRLLLWTAQKNGNKRNDGSQQEKQCLRKGIFSTNTTSFRRASSYSRPELPGGRAISTSPLGVFLQLSAIIYQRMFSSSLPRQCL